MPISRNSAQTDFNDALSPSERKKGIFFYGSAFSNLPMFAFSAGAVAGVVEI
jgi:hypothetical protein